MDSLYGKNIPSPPGFVPPEAWPEYPTITEPVDVAAREPVGTTPAGIRWGVWPLIFEEYVSDTEPDLAAAHSGALARNRFVSWKRLTRTDTPRGWHAFSKKTWRLDGVLPLAGEYTDRWHKNARRELRIFQDGLVGGRYRIEPIEWDEYESAYRRSLTIAHIGSFRLIDLQKKLTFPLAKENTELWGVRHNGHVVAGTAVIYSPTHKISTHFAPFMLAEARMIYAATGLVDHWFARTKARGYRYAMTTTFWYPGKPKSWKGFSEFKSHFGFDLVSYPPVLWRFVGGRLF